MSNVFAVLAVFSGKHERRRALTLKELLLSSVVANELKVLNSKDGGNTDLDQSAQCARLGGTAEDSARIEVRFLGKADKVRVHYTCAVPHPAALKWALESSRVCGGNFDSSRRCGSLICILAL